MHGRATTGEDSEYLKKTLVRDSFVMSCGVVQSREKMSLCVKNTELWALKVSLARGDLATFCSARGQVGRLFARLVGAACVDAHLLTVDESFRTCRQ